MQTFLPYSNFVECANVLDYKRLGKQRIEALQILRILIGHSKSNAWKNHPAVKMWEGSELYLAEYLNACIIEWIKRGYKNTIIIPSFDKSSNIPTWLGDERLHSSHRASLLMKNPNWYNKFQWKEEPKIQYWWPK